MKKTETIKMPKTEAIKVLKKELQTIDDQNVTMTVREWEEHDDHMKEALDVVIEVLEQEQSEDCISRKALLEQIKKQYGNGWQFVDLIENAPSVVPSRAEGKWTHRQETHQSAICSNCKKVTIQEIWADKLRYYDYCPNCGAKMWGDEE